MPKFRNTLTGVVIDVDEDTAQGLGSAYEPADAPKVARGTRKRATATDDD